MTHIRQAAADDLDGDWLRHAFSELYAHFSRVSGRQFLRPDAYEFWRRNYEVTHDRSRLILIAESDGAPCGFIEGVLRGAPAYLIQERTGFVSHVYVDEQARRLRVAHQLTRTLFGWFKAKDLTRVELQIVSGNAQAAAFWTRYGFAPELENFGANLDLATESV
jgi:ribosomal protein S18 acetylase RimI-like enzyme